MTTVANSEFDLVNRILKDSGIDVRKLRGGHYSGMIEAVSAGEFNIVFERAADGFYDAKIDGFDAGSGMFASTQSETRVCPEWMAPNLCEGYGRLANGIKSMSNVVFPLAGDGIIADNAGSIKETVTSFMQRWPIMIMGGVLVAIGLVFVMMKSKTVQTGIKAGTKIATRGLA